MFSGSTHPVPVRPSPAWRELIAQHDRSVLLSLLAKGVRLDRARELTHETWARLYEQEVLGRLEGLELPGLAIAQASFLAAQDGRRAQRQQAWAPLDASPEAAAHADGACSAEDRLASRQALDKAREVLASCNPRSQEVFRLAYESPDLPQADIARSVGLSVQRVRQILWEVRGRIRTALEEMADG
jgi:RNA polymerase sigma factor (sigma-70 family)